MFHRKINYGKPEVRIRIFSNEARSLQGGLWRDVKRKGAHFLVHYELLSFLRRYKGLLVMSVLPRKQYIHIPTSGFPSFILLLNEVLAISV